MIGSILKYVEQLNSEDFNPEAKNDFSNILVKDWRMKGNPRLDAVFCKNSVLSRAKISTSAVIRGSLLINCEMLNRLTLAPVVSISKSFVYNSKGRADTVNSSKVENSELEIIGNNNDSTFINCSLKGGTYIGCKFYNCKIDSAEVLTSAVDDLTIQNSNNTKFI